HVDIASRLDNGELVTLIKDDSTGAAAPVYRDPAKTLLQVLPEAQTSVPDSAAYSFLGEPGADIWLLPQTQQEGLLWPGWSTELIAPGLAPGGIEWTLTGVDGPGSFALFQTGAFGQATVLWNSADGIDQTDSFVIPEATHAHGAWAFSAEGIYCLAFDRTARLAGSETTASGVLAVAVGRADPTEVDPAACFTDPGDDPGDEPGDGPGVTPSVAITNFAAGYVDGQSYTLTAEHSPAIDGATYRWELLQTGAQTWYTIRDAQGIVTTANLTFTAQQAWDGFAWRVALLDADGVRVAESASHEMRVSLPTQTGDGLHILGLAGHYHSSAPVTLTAALVPAETADATYRWSVQRADQARPQVVAGVSGDVLTLTAEQALNGATVSVERLVAGVVTHTSAVVTIAVDDHGAPAPQAVSVASEPLYTAGATVTLTASVTPTTALDRFQWYVKAPAADAATPVPGATSATYTFVATAGHDGAEVSVAVLGEDGQVVYGPSVAVRLAVSPLGDDEPGDEPGDEEPGGSERGDEEPGGEEPLDPKAPSDRDDSLPPTGVPAAGWMPLTVLTCLALGMVLAVWSRRTRTANPEGPGAS
ncbi:MAG: choice-of-anchor M domain-containing protein, partial [Bifidobacteriaceae bacterium]|nr:choice-of-anchor M domain-containing protein [Bifidobacteriaceae bacterium]